MLAAELLFQEVISVFVFGHLVGVVVGLAVNFDCDFGLRRFQRKVDIAVPTIDVHAGVLDLQIFGLFWAKASQKSCTNSSSARLLTPVAFGSMMVACYFNPYHLLEVLTIYNKSFLFYSCN